jgi:hypothetical protein
MKKSAALLFLFVFCLLASPSNQMSDNSLHTKKILLFCFAASVTKGKEKKISNCLKIFVCENMSFFSFFDLYRLH